MPSELKLRVAVALWENRSFNLRNPDREISLAI